MKILVVDDDREIRNSLRRSLSFNGYEVSVAEDGLQAVDTVKEVTPDLIILDVMMPHKDGLEVCRELRSEGWLKPILMLTARDGVSERVSGLDAGADDYLSKPFALEELLARVRSLIRRATVENDSDNSSRNGMELSFADLTMNLETRDVTRAGRSITLTRTEFDLLKVLMENPNKVLSRQSILEDVWGYDFPTSGNALEVYIGYVRRKTETDNESRLIHTVRGVGYVLRETAP